MTTKNIQSTARAFQRWFDERGADWPGHLYGLGFRAVLALKSMDQARVPDVIVRQNARDLTAFVEAYAAHSQKHGMAA